MSSPPRSVASLPELVLREVLAYLLVDTPRAPNRAAVLQTCSTLHDLGLPLLYKVIDLLGSSVVCLSKHAVTLFRTFDGLLTDGGRIPGLARSVVELRVGGSRLEGGRITSFDFYLRPVNLPRCTRLVIDTHTPLSSPLRSILPHLPITDLVLKCDPTDSLSLPLRIEGLSLVASHLGMSAQPWKHLDRVTYKGAILWDSKSFTFQNIVSRFRRLPLTEWSFRTLIVDLAEWREKFTDAFLLCSAEKEPFFKHVERIELRLSAQEQSDFRSRLQVIKVKNPVDVVRERLLPLIVFVGPDGKETRLIDANQ